MLARLVSTRGWCGVMMFARTPTREAQRGHRTDMTDQTTSDEPPHRATKCECGNLLTKGPGYSEGICHTCNKRRYKTELSQQDEDET